MTGTVALPHPGALLPSLCSEFAAAERREKKVLGGPQDLWTSPPEVTW